MNAPSKTIGKPLDRTDGLLKVTGRARYAGEYPEDGLLHGSVVSSGITRGRVVRIDASRALALPGVVAVITGAGGGMGREAALVFCAEGARVCVLGRGQEAIDATETAAQILEGIVIKNS